MKRILFLTNLSQECRLALDQILRVKNDVPFKIDLLFVNMNHCDIGDQKQFQALIDFNESILVEHAGSILYAPKSNYLNYIKSVLNNIHYDIVVSSEKLNYLLSNNDLESELGEVLTKKQQLFVPIPSQSKISLVEWFARKNLEFRLSQEKSIKLMYA